MRYIWEIPFRELKIGDKLIAQDGTPGEILDLDTITERIYWVWYLNDQEMLIDRLYHELEQGRVRIKVVADEQLIIFAETENNLSIS